MLKVLAFASSKTFESIGSVFFLSIILCAKFKDFRSISLLI